MNSSSSVRGLFRKADTWLLIILTVMSIAFLWDTFHFRAAAALFPRIVSGIVAVLCLYQLGENIWTVRRGRPLPEKKQQEEPAAIAWYWVVVALAVYLGLIVTISFNLATLVFMIVFPFLVGYRRPMVVIPFALVMTVAVAYSFGSILHVQLPVGLLGKALGW